MKKSLIGLFALLLTSTSFATYIPGVNPLDPFGFNIPDSNKQYGGKICGYKARWGEDRIFDKNTIASLKKIKSMVWVQATGWTEDENGEWCLQLRLEQYQRKSPKKFKLRLTEKECQRLEELQEYINTPGKIDFKATCLGKVLKGKIWVRK